MPLAAPPSPLSAPGCGVVPWPLQLCTIAALAVGWLWAKRAGLDIHDYDDLARTGLSNAWADYPEYFRSAHYDAYWPPLPHVARGSAIRLARAFGAQGAAAALAACHAVSIACLWGAWRALCGALRVLGGGAAALAIFTALFLFNAGTARMASSAYSEPDFVLFAAVACRIAVGIACAEKASPLAMIALGASLGLANLTRYEAWTLAAAMGTWLAWRAARPDAPTIPWRWAVAAAAIAGAPIVWWLWKGHSLRGNALHFLGEGTNYVGHYPMNDFAGRLVDAFLGHNPLGVAAGAALAALEIKRFARDARMRPVAIVGAVVLAWAIFKLAKVLPFWRYTWDALVIMFVPAALAGERLLAGLEKPRRAAAIAASGAALFACFAIQMRGEKPYLSGELRRFCREAEALSGEGSVLLRDCLAAEDRIALQSFRSLIGMRKAVTCDWIGACESLDPKWIGTLDIRLIVGKSPPKEAGAGAAPVLESTLGWKAWRIEHGRAGAKSSPQ